MRYLLLTIIVLSFSVCWILKIWFREMDFVAFSRALQVNVIMFSPVDSCYSFRPYFVAADLPTIFMHCGVLGDDAFSHRDKRDDSLVHCEALIPTESGAFFANIV